MGKDSRHRDRESVRQFAEGENDCGWHRRRQDPRKVKIVGNPLHRRILLVDVKETNGHVGNGRLEAAVPDGWEKRL
jgi:hypothetical protein